jgi:selenium metabolism protein YedF
MKTVDARGLACPQPVVLTRNAMQEAMDIVAIVSSADQADNVSRMAERAGWQVNTETKEDGYYVHLVKGGVTTRPEPTPDGTGEARLAPTVVVVSSNVMGRGDDELGAILMRSFFHTLNEVEPLPQTIIFFNTGVRLAVEGTPLLEDLQALQQKGVEILVCGTCLNYFNLKEKLVVGVVSNMYSIAETLLGAGNVVSL